MTLMRLIAAAALTIAIALFLAVGGKTHAAPARRAVIVELFTSEGCSSCPPADALLGRLSREGQVDGVQVFPLGFHVDYWNYLGWRDRFSAAAYSKRQESYARLLRTDGPYTPQMIVDGEEEFIGSDASRARQAIDQAASEPGAAEIELSWAGAGKLLVRVKAHGTEAADILLAVTEDNLSSQVKAGENNGHVLRHSAVVRDFRRIGQLQKGSFQTGVPLKLDPDWKRKDLHVVVFVQTPDDGKIQGAASITPES
jgi:hypothetical protein